MTGRIWLVRHASTEWTGHRWCGRTDPPLSTRGLEEANAVARRLRTTLPRNAIILTSPLRRATQTAEAIARISRDGVNRPYPGRRGVEVVPALIEVDFGAVDGRTWSEVEHALPDLAREILAGRQIDWPGGESATDFEARVESIRQLIGAAAAPLVLVSHAAVLGALAGVLARSPVLARVALAPATVLELNRHRRVWQPITGRA